MHDDKGPCGVCFKHIPSDWTKKMSPSHSWHLGIFWNDHGIFELMQPPPHICSCRYSKRDKKHCTPKMANKHIFWPYHPLAITSDFFMLPGIISCQPCHSKCPCHITRHLQLHRAPHGNFACPEGSRASRKRIPTWSRSAIRGFGWVRITLNAKIVQKMNGQQTMIYIYRTCFGPNCFEALTRFWHVPIPKWNTFQQSTVTIFRLAMSHPCQKSRTSGGSFTNPCFGTWDFPAEIRNLKPGLKHPLEASGDHHLTHLAPTVKCNRFQ